MSPLLRRGPEEKDEAREKALREFADRHGLAFSSEVDQGFMDPTFFLFGLGTDQVMGWADNVMDGDWKDYPIRQFDYSVEELGDLYEVVYAATLHYSVAMIPIEGVSFPYVRVQKKELLKRLEDDLEHVSHLHLDHDEVECGVKEFDKEFEVRSLHADFVRTLFDHDLMDAVLDAGRDIAYEIWNNGLIAYTKRLQPEELPRLLDAAKAFHDHVPEAARSASPA